MAAAGRHARLPAVVTAGMPRGVPASVSRQMPGRAGHAYAYCEMRNRLRPLRRPAVLDAGLAALLAVLSVAAVWGLIDPDGPAVTKLGFLYGSPQLLHWRVVGWLAAVSVQLGVLPLRRRFPLAVLAVTLAAATAHSVLLPATAAPADLVVAVAVYTVASVLSRPVSATVTATGLLLAVSLGSLGLLAMAADPGQAKTLVVSFHVKPGQPGRPGACPGGGLAGR